MSDKRDDTFYCSFVSIQYIICECGKTYPSEEALKKHLERDNCRNEINEYKCGVCGEIYPTEKLCLDHYDSTHGNVAFIDDHDYTGEGHHNEETDEFEHEEEVEDSKEGILQFYPLEHLSEGFQQEEVVEDSHEEITEVKDLHYIDGSEAKMILPIQIQRKIAGPKTKRVTTEKPADPKPKKRYNRKDIVCEVCGKNYASNAALRYHQRVHTGERPYKCSECPKTFTMPLFLQVHVRTHTGERPYRCRTCPKAFSNKAALLRHDRVHTGVKPYACPKCGKSFSQSNSMKLHYMTVHLKQPAPYKSKSRKMKERERDIQHEREIEQEFGYASEKMIIRKHVKPFNAKLVQTEPEVSREPRVKSEPTELEIKFEPIEPEEEVVLYEDVDPEEISYEVIYES